MFTNTVHIIRFSVKCQHCALVRPILEYGPLIRDPANGTSQLERVKQKFSRNVSFIVDIRCHINTPFGKLLELLFLFDRVNGYVKRE